MIRNITLTSIGHAACTIIRMILMLLMSLSDVNGNGLAAVIQFLILGIVQAVGISFLGLHALRSRGLLTGWSTAMRAVASDSRALPPMTTTCRCGRRTAASAKKATPFSGIREPV